MHGLDQVLTIRFSPPPPPKKKEKNHSLLSVSYIHHHSETEEGIAASTRSLRYNQVDQVGFRLTRDHIFQKESLTDF